ncbi:3'-5' exonuclease [Desulfovibrio ferrophilus]|nr:3'-5' exonuclease [Desulfovibrio ferrophilus]
MIDIEQYRRKISKDEINELPLQGYEGDIMLVTNEEDAEYAVNEIADEPLLGFDTESRPAFKKGMYFLPSLIQIATSSKVYIFQLSKTPFPEALRAIFEDKKVIKSGVAVRDDVKDLQKLEPFKDAGFLDLGAIALEHKLETHGLRNLAAKFLGIRISKAARCTNWANKSLTKAQIRYAATDAWISRELFLQMNDAGLIPTNGNGKKPKKK